ncbi:MAG: 23S rRNA (adenine(1618)-N(6))-methyltransferase RlmF [Motiliproteus sp.]
MSRQPESSMAAKRGLHPRNKHREGYDFERLIKALPQLAQFVSVNRYNNPSVDFSDPEAVKALNKALLKQSYGLENWDIPDGYLCPPIPGRADYIHHLADILASANSGIIPRGKRVKGLDIGVGANCVYPIIGSCEYGWSFTGTDISPIAVNAAKLIVASNPGLKKKIECRLQQSSTDVFKGILNGQERFDFTLCNPPFHASQEDASAGTRQKLKNLHSGHTTKRSGSDKKTPVLNFGGQSHELWCEGGEIAFIQRMIEQSAEIACQCYCFSTLVSKKENLPAIYRSLKKAEATQVKTVEMAQGKKLSRFVSWSFLDAEQRQQWRQARWQQ